MAEHLTTQKLCNWFIQYAAEKGKRLTPVKLNHLAVLADWWYWQRRGEFLLHELPEAWPQGPQFPTIFHEYKDQAVTSPIEHPSRRQPPMDPADEAELRPFLVSIWNLFGKYTARQLVRINCAAGSPWLLAQGASGKAGRQTITREHVEAYFKALSK